MSLEEVELTAEQAAGVRVSAPAAAVRGPLLAAGFLLAAGVAIGAGFQPLLGLVLIGPGLALAAGAGRALGRPRRDAARRQGLRAEGPWTLVRAELEEAGSLPPRVLWTLRTVLPKPVEVPAAMAAGVDPEGAGRLAARLATGAWPGGARVPVSELSGSDAVVVVGRRSHAVAAFEVR